MLIGEFRHNLDPKGRVTIPSKFREDLSSFVMTKGLDDCLFLYPSDQWEKIENKLKELPMTNKAVRSFVRTFFSGAVDCEFCLLYTSPSPRDRQKSRMPSSA